MTGTWAEHDKTGRSVEFAEWVEPHLPVMRRVAALRAVGFDPDDIVQEALLNAWRKRATYAKDRGTVRTWLLALTADQARRARTRQSRPEHLGVWESPAVTADAEADIDLRRAVAALPARQREAVSLYYYVDLSIQDASELMRCAPGTVKSTLADARRNLAERLGDASD